MDSVASPAPAVEPADDEQNQRYKKAVGGSRTHYIWQGGEVIGEYDGATTSALTSSTLSRSRVPLSFTTIKNNCHILH
jgi:hypothetical protein